MSSRPNHCLIVVALSVLLTACSSGPPPNGGRDPLFTATEIDINRGERTTLSWDVESLDPAGCSLTEVPEGGEAQLEDVSCQGSKDVLPEITTTYQLEARSFSEVVFSRDIVIKVTAITEFAADKPFIQRGDKVTLTWRAVNSDSCFITFKARGGQSTEPEEVECQGSRSFTPQVTTLYRFSALGADGETFIEENLTVTVEP